MVNIGVMLSGRGSNFKAIHRAVESGEIANARIACVFSNKKNAEGLRYAEENGIATYYLPGKAYLSREDYDQEVLKIMRQEEVDLICLAGYMRIVSEPLVNAYNGRMMNIHPSLLPAFTGLDGQKQALEHGVKVAGCTVHFVDGGLDTGPIILQQCVNVENDDTEDTLSERILREEHRLYPRAVALFTAGKLKVDGRKVRIG